MKSFWFIVAMKLTQKNNKLVLVNTTGCQYFVSQKVKQILFTFSIIMETVHVLAIKANKNEK